jgi:hypothetical protein
MTNSFEAEIIQRGEKTLRDNGFIGALEEFAEARDNLNRSDNEGAILEAFKSVESSLKQATDKNSGDITVLSEAIRKAGFLSAIPEEKAKSLQRPVFHCLAVLRNELSGHGTGKLPFEVPRSYAVLAIHFAGALNQFIVEQYLNKLTEPIPTPGPQA